MFKQYVTNEICNCCCTSIHSRLVQNLLELSMKFPRRPLASLVSADQSRLRRLQCHEGSFFFLGAHSVTNAKFPQTTIVVKELNLSRTFVFALQTFALPPPPPLEIRILRFKFHVEPEVGQFWERIVGRDELEHWEENRRMGGWAPIG